MPTSSYSLTSGSSCASRSQPDTNPCVLGQCAQPLSRSLLCLFTLNPNAAAALHYSFKDLMTTEGAVRGPLAQVRGVPEVGGTTSAQQARVAARAQVVPDRAAAASRPTPAVARRARRVARVLRRRRLAARTGSGAPHGHAQLARATVARAWGLPPPRLAAPRVALASTTAGQIERTAARAWRSPGERTIDYTIPLSSASMALQRASPTLQLYPAFAWTSIW